MSEYQLYEFQSLDRVLTAADKAYLERLSSRVELTATSARFNYSYGDFRGKPAEVLERCFDIMLYQANFGITQLMIRLPKEAAVPELYEPYCVPYAISVEQTDRSTIIDISISSEEGRGWIGEEGNLSDLVQIRAALMQGDLRVLYLAWLAAGFSVDAFDWDSTTEPPLPPSLKKLPPELKSFANIFEIDSDLIDVAAASSDSADAVAEEPIADWISALSEAERNQYLLRVANGESHVGIELVRRLRQQFGEPIKPTSKEGRRSFAGLVAIAEQKTQQREQATRKKAAKAEAERIAALGGPKVELRWLAINELAESGQAKNYEKAVGHLRELRAIAEQDNKLAAFDNRLQELKEQFRRKKSLIAKLDDAKL